MCLQAVETMEKETEELLVNAPKWSVKTKIKGWVQRFLPAEVVGTIVAIAVSSLWRQQVGEESSYSNNGNKRVLPDLYSCAYTNLL